MTILLPTLAVTVAAFCVWLLVRVINRRERWAIAVAILSGSAVGLYFLRGVMLAYFGVPDWASDLYRAIYWPLIDERE
jgi:hypothetical protein